jgi:crotonobetainyl-CoA:carnitine CoA-transferase CaiB-like acyl-CoA transferase
MVERHALVRAGRARRGRDPEPASGPAGYPRILTPERRPQRTADGWISILPYSRAHYEALFREGGRGALVSLDLYADARARIKHSDTLYQVVRSIVVEQTDPVLAGLLLPGTHSGLAHRDPRRDGRTRCRCTSTRSWAGTATSRRRPGSR